MHKVKNASHLQQVQKRRAGFASWQIHVLVGAENAAKFCVLLPLLTEEVWRGRGLGVFTVFCLLGCLVNGFLERILWKEELLFSELWRMNGRKLVLTVYFGLFCFFLAQDSVMIRLSGEVMLHYVRDTASEGLLYDFRETGGSMIFRYSFFFLPLLVSSACNSLIYMRKLFRRLYEESVKGWKALQKDWVIRGRDVVWWGFVFLSIVLALAFRDRFALAGFFCAYNWQALAAVAVGAAAVMWTEDRMKKRGIEKELKKGL